MTRLDVGCGDFCAPGWVGVDPFYEGAGIVKAPAQALPYEAGSVDAIRCSHALEHIAPNEIPAALAEFRRVLAPEGELWLAVPDSLYVLQHLIDAPLDPWSTIMVHGQGRWPGDAHLTAFAPDTLAEMLTAAGFVGVVVRRAWTDPQRQTSIIAEARAPAALKRPKRRPRAAAAPPSSVRLSVIVPTIGRPTLSRTLASILDAGISLDDELVVVNDGDRETVRELVEASGIGERCRLVVAPLVPAGGDFGQPARNFGMGLATGSHLVFTQDDNAFAPGALDAVRHEAELEPGALHFWRVRPQGGQWVWTHVPADGLPALGQIDADCGVVPNDPTRLGRWGDGYNGDADFWRATAAAFLPAVVWHEELISGNQRFI